MKKPATKEEALRQHIARQTQNINDELYINLTRFLGVMFILIGVAVLISNGLRITMAVVILFVIGLAILAGAELWSADDKRTEKKAREIEDEMEDEESAGTRRQNFTQYT